MVSESEVAILAPNSTPSTEARPTTSAVRHAKVPVATLVRRPHGHRRQDRQQRRRLGLDLPEPERDERRDEEDSTPHAEEPRQHSGSEAEHDSEDDGGRRHATRSQTPTPVRRARRHRSELRRDPLLEHRSEKRATGGREPDERRVFEVDLAAVGEGDHSGEGRDPDRAERGRGGLALRNVRQGDEQRDGDQPTSDARGGRRTPPPRFRWRSGARLVS